MNGALHYARELIGFESISRQSNVEVSDYVEKVLRQLGFSTERVDYEDDRGVAKSNVIGKRGAGRGGLAYFGHTDVVPADDWSLAASGPFQPTVLDSKLYGRGSCDMKGSVACMLAAAERVAARDQSAPLYFICTADEEIGYGGARQVVENSSLFAELRSGGARGVIGEPTRLRVVHGHKGTYGFVATSRGRAAHSSTREGCNANLAMIPFLAEMKRIYDETETSADWQNDEFDPPTITWNIGINDHTRAVNITPPQSICTVYFRPMPGQDADQLVERARQAAVACGIEFDLKTANPPLYVDPNSEYIRTTLRLAEQPASETVAYGTDGCVFSVLTDLVVLGPGDIAQAHTSDEWIALDQLEAGTDLYCKLIKHWCCSS